MTTKEPHSNNNQQNEIHNDNKLLNTNDSNAKKKKKYKKEFTRDLSEKESVSRNDSDRSFETEDNKRTNLQTKGLYDRVQELHRNMDEHTKILNEIKSFNNNVIDELKKVKAK